MRGSTQPGPAGPHVTVGRYNRLIGQRQLDATQIYGDPSDLVALPSECPGMLPWCDFLVPQNRETAKEYDNVVVF